MNKVDLYVNGFRLDLFDDEEITINLSVQNVQDISKVFTDFTQGFTVPASPRNNEILQHYYNSNITSSNITTETVLNAETIFLSYEYRVLDDGGVIEGAACCIEAIDELGNSFSQTSTANTFDGRLRQEARIEINSLPFRTGVVEIENVQLKGTEPYAYTLTFYGDVVTLVDLFGEDYLYDLDFSAYNHRYDDVDIYDRLTTPTYAPLFYPLCSPVKNWFYQSEGDAGADNVNNIAFRGGGGGEGHQGERGIRYYEFKPALKVTAILTAIEAKYGISFTGSFLSAVPFIDLSLWLHRKEGYMYQDQPNAMTYQKINFQTKTGIYFDLANDTFDIPSDFGSSAGTFEFSVTVTALTQDANFAIYVNGGYRTSKVVTSTGPFSFVGVILQDGDRISLRVKTQDNTTPLTYRVTPWSMVFNPNAPAAPFSFGTASMSASATITAEVRVSELMPEIKVKDFLAGVMKMYNMVIVPTTSTSFLLQTLDDWYAAGSDKDFQDYLDITEYVVNRPPLYKEIEFKYQPTEQILGFQYQQTNDVGFGDLNTIFTFDGEELLIDVPFECPLFERLTDQHDDSLTNVIVYKSITSETNEDGTFNPYLGAPIVFYAEYRIDISANPIGYVNADGTHERVDDVWYANTSNRSTSAADSHSICFGGDIDPFHLQSVNQSLYYTEWSNYITDLYSKSRRLYNVEAVLPIGKIITLNLQNAIIWNNTKYLINNVSLNMTTGKATFELLNVV
jgi:hypothetical protein